jgi:hypothetical protein
MLKSIQFYLLFQYRGFLYLVYSLFDKIKNINASDYTIILLLYNVKLLFSIKYRLRTNSLKYKFNPFATKVMKIDCSLYKSGHTIKLQY